MVHEKVYAFQSVITHQLFNCWDFYESFQAIDSFFYVFILKNDDNNIQKNYVSILLFL